MSNYWDMREGKVNIAHALMSRGWNVLEYKKDESDSMTDYFSPAAWGGLATKNGYILVVDKDRGAEEEKITQYNPKGNLSQADREKISKLEQMTVERGCTPDEANTAKKLITEIESKIDGNEKYVVVGLKPAYMGNPGKSKWHIEKDGKIYDKGTGITKYADIPQHGFDIITENYKKGYDTWSDGTKKTLSDDEIKVIKDFKNLILRFERVVSGMNTCGDGTAETEAEGQEQSKQDKTAMEKIIEKVTKKVIRPIEKAEKTINLNDVLSFSNQVNYWIAAEIWDNNKGESCVTYELLGSEKRGYQRLHGTSLQGKRYYQKMSRLLKQLEEGKIKVYTLQEVEETTEIEKWVKKTAPKTTKQPKTEEKETANTTQEPTQTASDYDIKPDIDTRDNSNIFVVKVLKSLSKDEYIKTNEYMKSIGGYYSKFKHGFIFKADPTSILNGAVQPSGTSTETQEEAQPEQQEEQFTPVIIGDFEVSLNTNDNKKIYVVKVLKTLYKSDYKRVNDKMLSLGGIYNKNLHGFVFIENPIELLQTETAA